MTCPAKLTRCDTCCVGVRALSDALRRRTATRIARLHPALTRRTHARSGKVDQSAGSMLSSDVADKGFVLLCCGRPESDCSVATVDEVRQRVPRARAEPPDAWHLCRRSCWRSRCTAARYEPLTVARRLLLVLRS
jgi:hypothetical protein